MLGEVLWWAGGRERCCEEGGCYGLLQRGGRKGVNRCCVAVIRSAVEKEGVTSGVR